MSRPSNEFKKEIKIINKYGKVLEKFAGHTLINQKNLPFKKKEIQQAIKMMLVQQLANNQKCDALISGYTQLGTFQNYKNLSNNDLMDLDPKKYLIKQKKHKLILEKSNKEQNTLHNEIKLFIKILKQEIKKKFGK